MLNYAKTVVALLMIIALKPGGNFAKAEELKRQRIETSDGKLFLEYSLDLKINRHLNYEEGSEKVDGSSNLFFQTLAAPGQQFCFDIRDKTKTVLKLLELKDDKGRNNAENLWYARFTGYDKTRIMDKLNHAGYIQLGCGRPVSPDATRITSLRGGINLNMVTKSAQKTITNVGRSLNQPVMIPGYSVGGKTIPGGGITLLGFSTTNKYYGSLSYTFEGDGLRDETSGVSWQFFDKAKKPLSFQKGPRASFNRDTGVMRYSRNVNSKSGADFNAVITYPLEAKPLTIPFHFKALPLGPVVGETFMVSKKRTPLRPVLPLANPTEPTLGTASDNFSFIPTSLSLNRKINVWPLESGDYRIFGKEETKAYINIVYGGKGKLKIPSRKEAPVYCRFREAYDDTGKNLMQSRMGGRYIALRKAEKTEGGMMVGKLSLFGLAMPGPKAKTISSLKGFLWLTEYGLPKDKVEGGSRLIRVPFTFKNLALKLKAIDS